MTAKKKDNTVIAESKDDRLISDLLGSAHVFAAAIKNVMEDKVLRSVVGEKASFTRLKVLKLLSLGETQTVGDIAIFLGVSAAAASKTVDKLVRRGYVERKEHAEDRRAAQLFLMDAGKRVLETYERERNARMSKAFNDYSATDLQKAIEILDRLSSAVMNHSKQPDKTCLHCGIYFHKSSKPQNYCGCRVHKTPACDYLKHRLRTRLDRADGSDRDRS